MRTEYYNNPPSFGKARIRLTPSEFSAKGEAFVEKFRAAEETIKDYEFWDLILDKEGYKLSSRNTGKEYILADKPKRHTPKNSILIRMFDKAHKVSGKITSFSVELTNIEEVRVMYKRITKAVGLEKILIVMKALEEQAQKKALKRKIKVLEKLS